MFQVPSFYTFEDMLRTKIQSKNVQRAITPKKTEDRVMDLVHCTPPQLVPYLCEVSSF